MRTVRLGAAGVMIAAIIATMATVASCSGTSRIVHRKFDVDVPATRVTTPAGTPVGVHVERFEVPITGQDPERIGTARTGVSKRYASVRLSEHPGDLLARTFERTLTNAGLEIADAGSADYTFSGTIGRFEVEERPIKDSLDSAVAYLRFETNVTNSAGQTVWSRSVEAEAVSYPALDPTKLQTDMIEQAISETVGAVVNDRDLWRALGLQRAR